MTTLDPSGVDMLPDMYACAAFLTILTQLRRSVTQPIWVLIIVVGGGTMDG